MKRAWSDLGQQHLWAEGSEAQKEAELILCHLMCWETMGMDVVIKPRGVKVSRWQTAPFECRWHCDQAFTEMPCFAFVPTVAALVCCRCGNILKHWASRFNVFMYFYALHHCLIPCCLPFYMGTLHLNQNQKHLKNKITCLGGIGAERIKGLLIRGEMNELHVLTLL